MDQEQERFDRNATRVFYTFFIIAMLAVIAFGFSQDKTTWEKRGGCLFEHRSERSLIHHGFSTVHTTVEWTDPDQAKVTDNGDGSVQLTWVCTPKATTKTTVEGDTT